jgi:hypothetical protein
MRGIRAEEDFQRGKTPVLAVPGKKEKIIEN